MIVRSLPYDISVLILKCISLKVLYVSIFPRFFISLIAFVFSCGDAVPVFQQNADKPYNVDLMQVIKTFGDKGKMMIGHCAGAMMFDFTGITKGKKVAVHPLAKPAIQNGTATDKKSEIDGNFFTAQDENTIWTMMPQVIEALK